MGADGVISRVRVLSHPAKLEMKSSGDGGGG